MIEYVFSLQRSIFRNFESLMSSAHLVEDSIGILQGLNFLLTACNFLCIVRPSVNTCWLQLGKFLKGFVFQGSVFSEVLRGIGEVRCFSLHLTFLCFDHTLLFRDVTLSLGFVRVELVLSIAFCRLGGVNCAFEIRFDDIQLANDASRSILVSCEIPRERIWRKVANSVP